MRHDRYPAGKVLLIQLSYATIWLIYLFLSSLDHMLLTKYNHLWIILQNKSVPVYYCEN